MKKSSPVMSLQFRLCSSARINLIIVFLLNYFFASSQEVITNLQYNHALMYKNYESVVTLPSAKRSSDTLLLPFFDDFANKGVYPKSTLWLDSFVYVNDHLQANAMSYGVATFDGLNQYGRPYITTTPNAYGTADTLTSKFINLSSFPQTDTTIFFSLLYQPMGVGDWPNEDDSLILEFKKLNTWETVWSTGGFSSPPSNPAFKTVIIPVNDAFYFVADFQFRFRNLATSGNNDHWHLDYVYLNFNRNPTDTVMGDISVIGLPSRILKNYTSMPWNQFVDNQQDETDTSFVITYRNNYADDRNLPFQYDAYEIYNGNNYLFDTIQSLSPFTSFSYFTKTYLTSDWLPYNINEDSVVIRVRQYFRDFPTDLSKENDTSYLDIPFYNYLAYDDGSAEKAYGLEGPGLKKFAYEFNLNKPDTLRGLMVHFTHITRDVSSLLFTMFVWDNINFATGAEDTLYKKDFLKPFYIDSINGFVAFKLDTPVYLNAGTFYVGWQQIDNVNMQIGLDVNNSAKSKIHIYASGNWFASVVEAAPMIRPVIGKAVNFINTAVHEKNKNVQHFFIYPNPANDYLNIAFSMGQSATSAQVFDLNGMLIKELPLAANSRLNISDLTAGVYIINLTDNKGTIYKPQRFIRFN
jgi:hypothetical protein